MTDFNFTVESGEIDVVVDPVVVDSVLVSGPAGDAATVAVGSVSTGEPGTSAAVSNSGSSADAVLDFVIPRGDVGPPGTTDWDLLANKPTDLVTLAGVETLSNKTLTSPTITDPKMPMLRDENNLIYLNMSTLYNRIYIGPFGRQCGGR